VELVTLNMVVGEIADFNNHLALDVIPTIAVRRVADSSSMFVAVVFNLAHLDDFVLRGYDCWRQTNFLS
jgi:hypothetical protein